MTFKRLAVAAVVAGALVVPGAAYADPPAHAVPPDIPDNCLGAWRHLQNSAGGAWAHGVFAEHHVATVRVRAPAQGLNFGEWLAQWKEENC